MMNFLPGAKGANEPHRHCSGDGGLSCDDDDGTWYLDTLSLVMVMAQGTKLHFLWNAKGVSQALS